VKIENTSSNIPEAKNRVLYGSIDAPRDIDITPEMVASHIKSLKSNNAAGWGGGGGLSMNLSSSFLKEGGRANCQIISYYLY